MTKVIGLTGRSGAGKSAAAAIFQKQGIPVIDADAVYHGILSAKNACTEELVSTFGREILGGDGLVDRKKLGNAVFGRENTPALLHSLNTITHKYIMAEIRALVQAYREKAVRAVLLDAPQLFEANADRDCDLVLGIVAPDEICISRIMARDGIERTAAERRLAAQHSVEYFRERCTAVIENTKGLPALETEICRFLENYGV